LARQIVFSRQGRVIDFATIPFMHLQVVLQKMSVQTGGLALVTRVQTSTKTTTTKG
jgi:hypothetical protein